MTQVTCPGLPGAWINSWLAAAGATVLDARVRLHWTTDGAPLAVLSASEIDPVAALVESWPDTALLSGLPIAKNWKGAGQIQRKVPVEAFAARARAARGHPYAWTLSSTMTDLCVDEHGEVAHAPFDPAGPGTIKWLHHRLMKVHEHVEPTIGRIRDSLAGRAGRVKDNGLGFDQTRLGSQADETSTWIDPVVEVLAFFGLALLPVRGLGADRRLDRFADVRERQRGWQHTSGSRDPRRFHWPAWGQPLDSNSIDALLDAWNPEEEAHVDTSRRPRRLAGGPLPAQRHGRHDQSIRSRPTVNVEPVVPISAIEHFVYCPRQCALIHCDGVWSDNAHTVRGTRAHRRVDSGRHRRERGRQVLRAIPLWSEVLGLSGRADAVEIDDVAVRPVEYKSGVRHGAAADLQLCAQALCLEEMLDVEIPHGYVWYGGPRRRVQIDFAPGLRRDVRDVIRRIRAQLLRFELPEAPNDQRCAECQLLHHCLPELTSAPRKVTRYMAGTVFECAS